MEVLGALPKRGGIMFRAGENLRKTLVFAATALMAGGVALAVAPTASAAPDLISCTADTTFSKTLVPGNSFEFNFDDTCNVISTNGLGTQGQVLNPAIDVVMPDPIWSVSGPLSTVNPWTYVAPSTPMAAHTEFIASGPGGTVTAIITVTDAWVDTTRPTPPAYLQQVGVPASGLCTDVQDKDLAWGTGVTGGWTKAWAQWINDGKGGEVCSRTLTYRYSSSRTPIWYAA